MIEAGLVNFLLRKRIISAKNKSNKFHLFGFKQRFKNYYLPPSLHTTQNSNG